MNKRSEYIDTPRNDDRKNCNQEQEFILHIQIEFHFFLFVVLFLTFEIRKSKFEIRNIIFVRFQRFKRVPNFQKGWVSKSNSQNRFESFPCHWNRQDQTEDHSTFPFPAASSKFHRLPVQLVGLKRVTKNKRVQIFLGRWIFVSRN